MRTHRPLLWVPYEGLVETARARSLPCPSYRRTGLNGMPREELAGAEPACGMHVPAEA